MSSHSRSGTEGLAVWSQQLIEGQLGLHDLAGFDAGERERCGHVVCPFYYSRYPPGCAALCQQRDCDHARRLVLP